MLCLCTCELVRVSINKVNLVSNWIVASLVGVFRSGRGLGTGESNIRITENVLMTFEHYGRFRKMF